MGNIIITTNPITHTDEAALLDDHAVDLMARAMKGKLRLKREQGFGGWHDIRQTSSMRLADLLLAAVAKGDPVDVANFAMMLFCRNESHEALKQSYAKFCGGRLSAAPQQPAPAIRGAHIKESIRHDAGAIARCSYCGRYSDDLNALNKSPFACDCGKSSGWCGSFKKPADDSIWSDTTIEALAGERPTIPQPRPGSIE